MSLLQILLPILVYILPIGFFMYMGIDVLLRNPRKEEHRLVSIIMGCYSLLFLAEYVRYHLPIEYSPMIVTLWFGNVGAMIPSFGLHFMAKFCRLDKKMPRFMYPYIFYLPLILVLITLISSENIFNSHQFIQMGMWKVPVYNAPYYTAITIGCMVSLIYMLVLLKGKSKANTKEQQEMNNILIYGVLFVVIWTIVFGYINFGGNLPPYPYIYAGLVWCFFLRIAMIKYDFLNFSSKRYEILFNLNPAAILLVDSSGRIKEANPRAKELFNHTNLERTTFYDIFPIENDNQWERTFLDEFSKNSKITDFETIIYNQNKQINVLIDGDYVFVENEPHYILILRDITVQKENQAEITFLAYHDPLTRLPNRRYFNEKLEEAIHEARKDDRQLAVMIIDLDLFKEANDRYGHKIGDELLQYVARMIKETVADRGMVGRLGGDEFIIFLDDIQSVSFVEETVQQLQYRFEKDLFIYEDLKIPIQMSIGVSFFPDSGTDFDTLVNHADKAMYQVKRSGGNNFQLS